MSVRAGASVESQETMNTRWKPHTLGLTYIIIAFVISSSFGCEENVEWTCKSGACLAAERVCDGVADCPDGSDETADTCLQTDCGTWAFRCTYGACVPKDAQCDGKIDCVDGSDEAEGLCRPDFSRPNTVCSSEQFQCASGTCIGQEFACNGQVNCPDHSDETVRACSANFCPAPFFRCGYGACIAADKRCDGIADCRDSTDESSCELNSTLGILQPPTDPFTEITRPLPTPSVPPVTSQSSCIAPSIPNSRIVYEHDESQKIEPGSEVPNFAQIKYKCRKDFFREGQDYSLCFNGMWSPPTRPICTRYCPGSVLRGVTFNAVCVYDDIRVECGEWIKPRTYVITNCRFKYRVPDHNPTQRLYCDDNGEWDYQPQRCEPVCGEELVESVPFAVNGVVTNITAVPWHVAIYKSIAGQYKHSCGGTILNAKVVITAAHCFWDNANEKLENKALFLVGAGKTLRDYNVAEPRAAHFRNISLISVPAQFRGANNNFKGDIAVLVLTNAFTLSTFIAPACVRWETGGAKYLTSDTYGQIAGWGRDETGNFSAELKTTRVPMSSYEICRKEAGPQLAESITDDKFCVLNKYNKNVCEGDSGGGFVVKRDRRHYLWGIVSNGVPNRATCGEYNFVNYVNIQFYETFITSIEIRNRPI